MALPGAPQTLAQALGISVEPVINFKTAADIAQGLQGGTTPKTIPVISESPVGPCKVPDMPLDILDLGDNSRHKIKHIVDLIPEFAEPYDWSEISGLMRQSKIGSLKPPFCPKGPVGVPFKMQELELCISFL